MTIEEIRKAIQQNNADVSALYEAKTALQDLCPHPSLTSDKSHSWCPDCEKIEIFDPPSDHMRRTPEGLYYFPLTYRFSQWCKGIWLTLYYECRRGLFNFKLWRVRMRRGYGN